ncbi:MAG: ABC transporter permease [Nanoarchaeota archaeon]|nr:ABC transporter permease [Nanoarchaeota archaeon]MBU1322269.1 ABC transporter permease [Nanoarchaeota archaeon]MBU1598022.1 ABC transporter permease [Nanoarchaeota archaeon]MBU2441012.1 ABC transporter permease [Nanoarchaeota archaeon]
MNLDEINYSLKNLRSRKMRSGLSILSILIGITSIFALISFGMGIQSYMDTLAEDAGASNLYIQPKGAGIPGLDDNFFLTQEDIDFVEKINGVDDITAAYFKAAEIKHRKQTKYYFAFGMNIDDLEFLLKGFNVEIIKGRGLKKGDMNKVVLGYNYQIENRIFNKVVKVGDKIEINGVEFEVIGFYSEVGNPQDDAQAYLTLEAFEELYPDTAGKFGFVLLNAEKGVDPTDLADKITDKLRKFKGQEEGKEDFFVQSFADIMETFGSIINILNGILVLIALISIVVATVNIMNTMYTAVLERTKEIGIMKSVGARNNNILFIFVFESGVIGLIGGILGVIVGFGIASMGGIIAATSGYSMLQPIFPWYLILGCIAFSSFVGAGAGLMPAIRASKLKPVDALRYE